MKLTRLRLLLGSLALVTGGATLLIADPASAAPDKPEAPAAPAAPAHGDACTAVPDSGPVFNFHDACHRHDTCYANKPYGRHEVGRLRCDNDFLANMFTSCSNRYPRWYQIVQREACFSVARTYYAGVRAGGAAFFY